MGVLGARSGDLKKALNGDPDATERVIFGYWLWPQFQKMLEEANLVRLPPVIHLPPGLEPPESSPHSEIDTHLDFLPAVFDRLLGLHQGRPGIEPKRALEAQLNILKRFRIGFDELNETLEKEVVRVEELLSTL